ncbi:translation elongation factor G, partial [mine drainage metagenome]
TADFAGEVDRALDVADVALFVVAASGVPADTAALWRRCREAGVPAVVFVNALDAERADYESVLRELESMVGPTLAPLEIPLGSGSDFTGVVDLLRDEALVYGPDGERRTAIPASVADLEARARASLLEAIVVGDDAMTERYLENEDLAWDELEEVLSRLMSDGRIVPVTVGSALRGVGVGRLVTLLDEIAESRPIAMVRGGEVVAVARD